MIGILHIYIHLQSDHTRGAITRSCTTHPAVDFSFQHDISNTKSPLNVCIRFGSAEEGPAVPQPRVQVPNSCGIWTGLDCNAFDKDIHCVDINKNHDKECSSGPYRRTMISNHPAPPRLPTIGL
jgi:hypothetical protein